MFGMDEEFQKWNSPFRWMNTFPVQQDKYWSEIEGEQIYIYHFIYIQQFIEWRRQPRTFWSSRERRRTQLPDWSMDPPKIPIRWRWLVSRCFQGRFPLFLTRRSAKKHQTSLFHLYTIDCVDLNRKGSAHQTAKGGQSKRQQQGPARGSTRENPSWSKRVSSIWNRFLNSTTAGHPQLHCHLSTLLILLPRSKLPLPFSLQITRKIHSTIVLRPFLTSTCPFKSLFPLYLTNTTADYSIFPRTS